MCFLGDVNWVSGENFKEVWGRWNHMCMCIKNCLTLYPQPSNLSQPLVLPVQCLILVTIRGSLHFNAYLCFYRARAVTVTLLNCSWDVPDMNAHRGIYLTYRTVAKVDNVGLSGGLRWIPSRSL